MVIKTFNENFKYLYKSIFELIKKKKNYLVKNCICIKVRFFSIVLSYTKKILGKFYLRPTKVLNDPNYYIKLTLNFETQNVLMATYCVNT